MSLFLRRLQEAAMVAMRDRFEAEVLAVEEEYGANVDGHRRAAMRIALRVYGSNWDALRADAPASNTQPAALMAVTWLLSDIASLRSRCPKVRRPPEKALARDELQPRRGKNVQVRK
jgi:hypothetical protein